MGRGSLHSSELRRCDLGRRGTSSQASTCVLHVCCMSASKRFMHQELVPLRCGMLILGMAFWVCGKSDKTFPVGRDRTNSRIPWLCKKYPRAGISALTLPSIARRREPHSRGSPRGPGTCCLSPQRWCWNGRVQKGKGQILTLGIPVILALSLEMCGFCITCLFGFLSIDTLSVASGVHGFVPFRR